MDKILTILLLLVLFGACQQGQTTEEEAKTPSTDSAATSIQESVQEPITKPIKTITLPEDKTAWVDMGEYAPSILQDIRYATDNNFVKQQIYDCGKCWLRAEAAEALAKIQQQLEKQKLSLLVFDCYRPRPMQQRLWDVKPDPRYVSPPSKGSNHTRGIAVDLTLADSTGKALDMGTPFDFFGKKGWHAYTDLPEEVLNNRKFLKKTMEDNGFKPITSEWWHYSLITQTKHALADTLWACP